MTHLQALKDIRDILFGRADLSATDKFILGIIRKAIGPETSEEKEEVQ